MMNIISKNFENYMHKICNKSLPQFCYKANQSHWSTIKDVNQNVIDA